MPVATVDDHGTHIFFEDSGIPSGSSTYTTLVMVHGATFHSAIFSRLVPLATEYKLRLVRINRRDYDGSTPLSADDLEGLKSGDKHREASFLQARGLEIAAFLAWFASTQNIPAISTLEGGDKVGGINLFGWSAGNNAALSVLANLDKLSTAKRDVLEEYLNVVILFDLPRFLLGLAYPPEIWHPFFDTTIPPDQLLPTFYRFVSSYYDHQSISQSINDLAKEPMSTKTPTLIGMSPEELNMVSDLRPFAADIALLTLSPELYVEQLRKALFDHETVKMCPKTRVGLIWCNQSVWEIPTVGWEMENMLVENRRKGGMGRSVRVVEQKGANHFAHWDDPRGTMQAIAALIASPVA
ncbi:hypothetical protein JAAARDRAFT_208490 [Jaapia argillacea MUCL 33604]|uniref:AB hydrolase-1 domain-containing protein n=1 Tax=Jaapia argillacea MUCL 33604 TaxID=933084 RepID=A0A067PWP1_9AGAM|nr:hypothetical protein JAAARDRAFT_208490 [Jaapia argillacea MUCL 33604]